MRQNATILYIMAENGVITCTQYTPSEMREIFNVDQLRTLEAGKVLRTDRQIGSKTYISHYISATALAVAKLMRL